MKLVIPAFVILIVLAGYKGHQFYEALQIVTIVTRNSEKFENITQDLSTTLLVLGDSTAAGVGTLTSADSVAGRLSTYMGATYTENLSENGAYATDIQEQLDQASLEKYDTVLIQVGANDVIWFRSLNDAVHEIDFTVTRLRDYTDRVIVMSAGNIGGAPVFPLPLWPIYTWRSSQLNDAFEDIVERRGAYYIDLYVPPSQDPFVQQPGVYLSPDKLHPSSKGYGLWFEKLKQEVFPEEAET